MALPKLYNPIVFNNNTTPALNEDNLNEISQAIGNIDDRVIEIAGDVIENIQEIIEATENPPYIGDNGNWYVWDTETGAYVDSGVDASISVEIADVTMLPVGSDPYVTNTGTDTDPVFHLFIPMGNDGSYNNLSNKPSINSTTVSGSSQGWNYGLLDIEPKVTTHIASSTLVPTGLTYEKGSIVWCKGAPGVSSQYLYKMLEDVTAGQNWYNKATFVTISDISKSLDAEIATRSELGAHNLLPCTMTSHSRSGVSATVNDDGTITLNNTSTGSNVFPIANSNLSLKAGRYIFTCLQTTGSDATFKAYVSNLGDYVNYFDYGSGVEFEIDHDVTNAYVGVMFASGVSFNNQVLKPMIRLASDSDSTYQPYAMTNKQLTDKVTDIETAIAPRELGTASQAYAKGDYLIMNDKLYKVTQAIVSGATLTVGTNIVQTSVAEELELNNIQLELTGISTNKGIIEGVFTNVIPLLTRDLMKCSGVVKVPGANSFGFNVFRVSSTMYYGFFHANDRVFTAISSSGTVTAYQIVGTAI